MRKTIELMAQRIAEKFNPLKIIVFGSWARGEASADSDVDFLIVMDCPHEHKRDVQVAIRRELREYKVPKDVIVANLDDVNNYRDAWWTVYQPALEEGTVLYEQ